MAANSTPGQDEFFVHSPGTGREYLRDLNPSVEGGPTVPILERNTQLQEALRGLAEISKLGGFVVAGAMGNEGLIERYGEHLGAVIQGAHEKTKKLTTVTKRHFANAFGLEPMAEERGAAWARSEARREYDEFKDEYGGSSGSQAREAMLRKLIHAEIRLGQPERPVTLPVERKEPELEQLSLQEVLLALRDDPRAGFLPASNHEKGLALAYLDYFDRQAEYPDGMMHQLDEIFKRRMRGYSRRDIDDYRQRSGQAALRHSAFTPPKGEDDDTPKIRRDSTYGTDEAIKTMRSITYEMGDFYLNAVEQIKNLRDLREAVLDINPTVKVIEEVGENHPALAAIIRYMDQSHYRKTGTNPVGVRMSIFRSRRDEETPRDEPGKNKIMQDAYTDPNPTKTAAKRLDKGKVALTTRDVRAVVDEVIEDQLKRASFWEARLRDTSKRRFAWQAGQRVLAQVS